MWAENVLGLKSGTAQPNRSLIPSRSPSTHAGRVPREPPPLPDHQPPGRRAAFAGSPEGSSRWCSAAGQMASSARNIMFRRLKSLTVSPALASGVASQPHQLQQCAPVSGTAKGKGKIKAGQPLKRSSIGKKGVPSSTGGGGGGRGRREAVERITQISESCLNASTPLRHLSPKERLREAKREELGLVSKERQRELDVAKAKAKAKSKGAGGDDDACRVLMGPPGLDYISLGLVDEEAIPKYELTVEDGRRLAKEYSRVLMRRHRARQTAESTLLKLKKEAIAALPEKLRAPAMVPDMTPFPANRYMATLTPPIEGYAEKVRDAAKKHSYVPVGGGGMVA
ncbi:hypothetical protein U9M48_025779 [Paspalum notatum var. saurae]|uniref:Copper ion binding protein n=1 Tax=Paspalum notatum var. saurae TaxID=547442 RepID=A0AAQ3WXG7_PASNO